MAEITPMTSGNLGSGGQAFGHRQTLEDGYVQRLSSEVERFMRDVDREAREAQAEGRAVTVFVVLTFWDSMVGRIERWLPPTSQLMTVLRDTWFPQQVLLAAQQEMATAAMLGLSEKAAAARMRTVLGLSKDPVKGMGGESGRLLLDVIDGKATSSLSWAKQNETWARTSATADFGESMLQQLRNEGYTHKRWMTRYDSRVRDTHAAVDRVTILLEETFNVGGTPLRYPGDPMTTSLGEVMNCRCCIVGVRF